MPTALLGCHISLPPFPLQPVGRCFDAAHALPGCCVTDTRAGNFFGKPEKTLDSWYSGHIICGSFAFCVTRAGVLKEENMTVARKFRLEADAVAQHLPET